MEITVLMPVYNGEKFLEAAIDSILQQSFEDFEFLIINDGSTDKTKEIILSYNDKRIRYWENEKNIKLIATLNLGISLSNGKYIARMDADDISEPNRLQHQYVFMEANPDVGLLGTWYETFTEQGLGGIARYVAEHEEIKFKQLYQIQVSHGTCMIRKEVLQKYNMEFDPKCAHAEDYDLFTRMSKVTKLSNLQYVGYKVRHHEDEVSRKFADIQLLNSRKIKHREFELIGFSLSSEMLQDYEFLNYRSYEKVQQPIKAVQNMLESILIANEHSNYLESSFLRNKLAFIWYHYCYTIGTKSDYLKSPELSSVMPFSTAAKWYLKSIFK